jgi:DNA/RNA-binding domain of Phe-tRNA-synthetase-like protein
MCNWQIDWTWMPDSALDMSFFVTDDCRRLGLRAGAIVFRNVHVAPASPELRLEIVKEAQAAQDRLGSAAAIRALREVIAFQNVLRRVGVNPRKDQPSLERLLGFALKRGDLPAINALVDAYNLVSIRSSLSLGAHDLDNIAPPVALRLLTGRESFTPLGRTAPETLTAGEYGYVDALDRVLCRLDVLQADFSRVTTATVNAMLIVEGTAEHAPDVFRQAFADAIELVTRYCGGRAQIVATPDE